MLKLHINLRKIIKELILPMQEICLSVYLGLLKISFKFCLIFWCHYNLIAQKFIQSCHI